MVLVVPLDAIDLNLLVPTTAPPNTFVLLEQQQHDKKMMTDLLVTADSVSTLSSGTPLCW